jgi:5'-nucleotidase
VWNLVGFDAHAISYRDFIKGPDVLQIFAEAVAPSGLLGTTLDVRQMRLHGLVSKLVVRETTGGMKVGIVSWFSNEVAFGMSGALRLASFDVAAVAEKALEARIAHGVDAVVLLAPGMPEVTARNVTRDTEVDVVLTDEDMSRSPAVVDPVDGRVRGFAMGCSSDCDSLRSVPVATVLSLASPSGSISVTELNAVNVPLAADISAVVNPLRTALFANLNDPIAEALDHIEGGRHICRFVECAAGVLTTDAMQWWAQTVAHHPRPGAKVHMTPGIETSSPPLAIALANSGGIRASISRGPVSVHAVRTMLPFSNFVTVLRVSGRKLVEVISHSFANWVSNNATGSGSGGFLQIGANADVEWSAAAGRLVCPRQACGRDLS